MVVCIVVYVFVSLLVTATYLNRQSFPSALIDLVETDCLEEAMAFVDLVSKEATKAGGHVAIVNRALIPLIVPGERADHATQLLLVTEYPSKAAAEQALAN